MADEDEIILVELDDDELVQQMHDDLYDGMQEEIVEGVVISRFGFLCFSHIYAIVFNEKVNEKCCQPSCLFIGTPTC